jgi:hypothetical protein
MSRCSAFALSSLTSNWRIGTALQNSRQQIRYGVRTVSFSQRSRTCHANADPVFPVSPHSAARLRRFREFERARPCASSTADSRSAVRTGVSRSSADAKDTVRSSPKQDGSTSFVPPYRSEARADERAVATQEFDSCHAYEYHDDYVSSVLQMRGDPLDGFSDRIVIYRGNPHAKLMVRICGLLAYKTHSGIGFVSRKTSAMRGPID